ncbi:MAG TPA: hypothetical protein VF796_19970 [Humisphaera sp.]
MTVRPAHPAPRPTSPAGGPRRARGAFTLIELLIVIGLIILAMAIAVASFRVLSSDRSIEAAQNQISAYIADARAQAVGLQQPRGVIIFNDKNTGRVTMLQVFYPQTSAAPRPQIALFPNRDEMAVPAGIGIRGVINANGYDTWPEYAIIMFDGDGKLMMDNVSIPTGTLATRLNGAIPTPATARQPNIGFLLYDLTGFQDTQPAAQNQWLIDNAMPYLINRYNGTLMRGV